jgi:hypothetical protein
MYPGWYCDLVWESVSLRDVDNGPLVEALPQAVDPEWWALDVDVIPATVNGEGCMS